MKITEISESINQKMSISDGETNGAEGNFSKLCTTMMDKNLWKFEKEKEVVSLIHYTIQSSRNPDRRPMDWDKTAGRSLQQLLFIIPLSWSNSFQLIKFQPTLLHHWRKDIFVPLCTPVFLSFQLSAREVAWSSQTLDHQTGKVNAFEIYLMTWT